MYSRIHNKTKVHSNIHSKKLSIKGKSNNDNSYIQRTKTKKIITMLSNLKKFTDFYKKLSADDKKTLQNYKYNDYIEINKYLYNGNKLKDLYIDQYEFLDKIKSLYSKNTVQLLNIKSINPGNIKQYVELYVNKNIVEQINAIDKIFSSPNIQKLNGDEILYRGTMGHSITKPTSRIGNELIFKNFISTSTEQTISERFMYQRLNKNKEKHCCMYIFHNMKDVPFIYLPWQIENSQKLHKKYISQAMADEFEFLLPRGLKFKIIKKELINYKTIENRFILNQFKKLSFDKLSKLLVNMGVDTNSISLSKDHLKTMDDETFKKLYNKMSMKIQAYHLEYIGQEPINPIQPYVYKSDINLHILEASTDTPPMFKIN